MGIPISFNMKRRLEFYILTKHIRFSLMKFLICRLAISFRILTIFNSISATHNQINIRSFVKLRHCNSRGIILHVLVARNTLLGLIVFWYVGFTPVFLHTSNSFKKILPILFNCRSTFVETFQAVFCLRTCSLFQHVHSNLFFFP